MLRQSLAVLFWLVVLLYVINQPASAGHTAIVLVHAAEAAARALARFASDL